MAIRKDLLLLGIALALGGCSEAATHGLETRPVRTLVVDLKSIDDARRAIGEVRPRYESELGFRVSGKLISRPTEVGDTVKTGDVLARLDEQEYRSKLKSAEADLVAADAVLVEARAAEGRQRLLLASGATTRANYDAAFKNMRSAGGKLDAAKASLELATDQLSYCELRAEFDGVVTATGAEAGQVV